MRQVFVIATACFLVTAALAQPKTISLSRTGGEVHVVAHVGDTLLFNTTDDASGSTGFTWRGPQFAGDPVFSSDSIFVKVPNYDQVKKQADEAASGGPPKVGGSVPHLGDHFARMRAVKVGRAGIEFIHSRFGFDHVRLPEDTVCDFVVDVQPSAAPAVNPPAQATTPKSTPVVIAVDGWVVAAKIGGVWSAGDKTLAGNQYPFRILSADATGKPRLVGIEYSDGPPQPSLDLKGVNSSAPPAVYFSGEKAQLAKVKRIKPKDSAALKIARAFAKQQGKSRLPVVIQDGVRIQLGSETASLLAIGSGATLQVKSKSDYAAVLFRVGNKTQQLVFESKFGQMRGPFTSRILAIADFDGSGSPKALISTKDPWGEDIRLVRLTPTGAKELHRASRGE